MLRNEEIQDILGRNDSRKNLIVCRYCGNCFIGRGTVRPKTKLSNPLSRLNLSV